MNDFPKELKQDWTTQEVELQALTRRLRRGDLSWRALLVATVGVAVVGVAFGIWFAWIAIRDRDLFHALAAVTMLTAIPPAAVAEFKTRRDALRWYEPTPEGVLRHALQRVEATGRLLRITLINAIILPVLAAVVWICVATGMIAQQPALVLITLLWTGFGLLTFGWVHWRGRTNLRERERCQRLLREFADAGGAD